MTFNQYNRLVTMYKTASTVLKGSNVDQSSSAPISEFVDLIRGSAKENKKKREEEKKALMTILVSKLTILDDVAIRPSSPLKDLGEGIEYAPEDEEWSMKSSVSHQSEEEQDFFSDLVDERDMGFSVSPESENESEEDCFSDNTDERDMGFSVSHQSAEEEEDGFSDLVDERDMGFSVSPQPENEEERTENEIHNNIAHHVMASLVKQHTKCGPCLETMRGASLSDFAQLSNMQNSRNLTFCSNNVFTVLSHVDNLFISADKNSELFVPHSFKALLEKIVQTPYPPFGCDEHRIDCMSLIIYKFLIKRYDSKAQELKRKYLDKSSAQSKASRKNAKLIVPTAADSQMQEPNKIIDLV